jgi:O-antigen/teichoic acid export membrane protein
MRNKIQTFITNKINRSNERSTNAIKNIIASFGIKGISITVQLLLVPLTINYVNPTQYGIWLTLSSIVAWFSFFDIGFGNGLRNRFAEAKAKGDYAKAKAYVSTTYICIGVIFAIVWILFFFINFFLDWSKILNAPAQIAKELSVVALIVVSFLCLQMVLKLINTVLIADQKPAKSAFFDMIGQVLALLVIFILTKTTHGSLLYLALSLGCCPILVMVISSCWFYKGDYKLFSPSIKLFEKKIIYDTFNLGSKFFVLQISGLVMFQTSNILIAQLFSPEKVTEYNIAYRYFNIPIMVMLIILSPMWSAFTEAFAKDDKAWMKNSLKMIRKIYWYLLALATIMLFVSSFAYKLWIGNAVNITFIISISQYLYAILLMWVQMNMILINGIGKVQIQFLFSIAEIILFIPTSYLFGKLFGMPGIIYAMTLFVGIRAIWSPLQLDRLINEKAVGIWNK